MADIDKFHIGMGIGELALNAVRPAHSLTAFLVQTENVPMPDSRRAAQELGRRLHEFLVMPSPDPNRTLTQQEIIDLFHWRDQFEKDFERENKNIDVFTVMPKGIYSTRALIENPQNKFPESVRSVFTDQILYDLSQAGRCLAFEIPTGCVFHVLRATESLMCIYYETVAGKPWARTQRDWGAYVKELQTLSNANQNVISRLNEIRAFDRNPSIHPTANISLDKAPIIFELCTGVIYSMAEEIRKLTP